MVDDFLDPEQPNLDCHSVEDALEACGCKSTVQRHLVELIVDPGSGELSGSRFGLVGYLVSAIIPILWVMVVFHQWQYIEGVIKWTFAPLCGIYAASTWKKYNCNRSGDGE